VTCIALLELSNTIITAVDERGGWEGAGTVGIGGTGARSFDLAVKKRLLSFLLMVLRSLFKN
jgi:hypothetical protein